MESLSHQGGEADLQVGKAVGLGRGGQRGQHTVVERVVVEQVSTGGADEGDDDGKVVAQRFGDDRDQELRNGVGHARALGTVQHTHEHAGAQHHHNHVDHVGSNRADHLPLGLLVGIVDQQSDGRAHAEQNFRGGQAHDQGHDDGRGEEQVDKDHFGSLPGLLLRGELHLSYLDLHILGDAQALALLQPQVVADSHGIQSA